MDSDPSGNLQVLYDKHKTLITGVNFIVFKTSTFGINKNYTTFAFHFAKRGEIIIRVFSSAGSEHLVYTEGVGGSNPSKPTKSRRKTAFFVSVLSFLLATLIL